jgi:hypothetical protein
VLEQIGHDLARREEVFKVVQQQEQVALVEGRDQRVAERTIAPAMVD